MVSQSGAEELQTGSNSPREVHCIGSPVFDRIRLVIFLIVLGVELWR